MATPKTLVKRITRQQTRSSRNADVAEVSITRSHQHDGQMGAAKRYEYAKYSIIKIGVVLLMLMIMGFLAHTSTTTSVSEGKQKPRGSCSLFHLLSFTKSFVYKLSLSVCSRIMRISCRCLCVCYPCLLLSSTITCTPWQQTSS